MKIQKKTTKKLKNSEETNCYMDYTVILHDIEKKVKKKIKNTLIQWQSEGKFSSWESLEKTFEDEDISTIDELIETIAINPMFFWDCLEHGLSYYIRDAKLLFLQDNKRTAMTEKEIDNMKTSLRIFINREYTTEEEVEDLFREEEETKHLDYKTWGKFIWFLDRNTYNTIVRAEVKKFIINDPTINKIYEEGEVELSDEEYDEGFDESMKRVRESNYSLLYDTHVKDDEEDYLSSYRRQIYDFLWDNREDSENGFDAFSTAEEYYKNAKENLKEDIINNTEIYSYVHDFQSIGIYVMIENAIKSLNIPTKEVLTHSFEDEDYSWFDRILREYYFDETLEEIKEDIIYDLNRHKEEEE